MGSDGRHIPNRFRKYRSLLLYNQKSAAWIMEVSQEDMCRWENGEKMPSVENLLKLKALTETPIEELLHEKFQQIKRDIEKRKRLYREGLYHEEKIK